MSDKRKPVSEETRHRMSEARKGYKFSEEAKAKMRAAKLGKPLSEEHRKKLAEAHTGTKRSEEHRARMAEAARKRGAANALHTPEVKAKAAAARTAKLKGVPRSEEVKAKERATKRAHPRIMTDEMRAKFVESAKQRYANTTPEERRKQFANFTMAGRLAARELTHDTSLELLVEGFLQFLGADYEKQKQISFYTVDFFLPDDKTVIEVMGCYWHRCEQCGYSGEEAEARRKKDAHRKKYLEACGYTIWYIWEHEIRELIRILTN